MTTILNILGKLDPFQRVALTTIMGIFAFITGGAYFGGASPFDDKITEITVVDPAKAPSFAKMCHTMYRTTIRHGIGTWQEDNAYFLACSGEHNANHGSYWHLYPLDHDETYPKYKARILWSNYTVINFPTQTQVELHNLIPFDH